MLNQNQTGSGMSVNLKEILEEQIQNGGGFMFIDAKGDTDELKISYLEALKTNRSDDVLILDFSNIEKNLTHHMFNDFVPKIYIEGRGDECISFVSTNPYGIKTAFLLHLPENKSMPINERRQWIKNIERILENENPNTTIFITHTKKMVNTVVKNLQLFKFERVALIGFPKKLTPKRYAKRLNKMGIANIVIKQKYPLWTNK